VFGDDGEDFLLELLLVGWDVGRREDKSLLIVRWRGGMEGGGEMCAGRYMLK
jgi:hypothetical protein